MTIPDRPLELDIETVKVTLGDMEIFDLEMAESQALAWLNSVRKFLIRHSVSWTAAEIRDIDVDELQDVAAQVVEATQRRAVPLANSNGSKTGRASKTTSRPAGRRSSSSAKSSASRPTSSESG